MNKGIFMITVAVASLFFCNSLTWAAEGWETNLIVASGTAESRLSFGQQADATDLDDGRYDVPAMLTGTLQAAFVGGGGSFWRDIRSTGADQQEWRLLVGSSSGQPVKISWDSKSLPAGYLFELIDGTNSQTINMESSSVFTVEEGASIDLTVRVSVK